MAPPSLAGKETRLSVCPGGGALSPLPPCRQKLSCHVTSACTKPAFGTNSRSLELLAEVRKPQSNQPGHWGGGNQKGRGRRAAVKKGAFLALTCIKPGQQPPLETAGLEEKLQRPLFWGGGTLALPLHFPQCRPLLDIVLMQQRKVFLEEAEVAFQRVLVQGQVQPRAACKREKPPCRTCWLSGVKGPLPRVVLAGRDLLNGSPGGSHVSRRPNPGLQVGGWQGGASKPFECRTGCLSVSGPKAGSDLVPSLPTGRTGSSEASVNGYLRIRRGGQTPLGGWS